MSWEMGLGGFLAKALFLGLAASSRGKGPQVSVGVLEPVAEKGPPPLPREDEGLAPIQLIASDPPPPAKPLKAPHLATLAARRFHAYMLEMGAADPMLLGPLRSATVYGLYVEWSTEDEGREALPDNRFLPALRMVPGVRKLQTIYQAAGKERRSYRWWFEPAPKAKERREVAEAALAVPKPKKTKKRRRK